MIQESATVIQSFFDLVIWSVIVLVLRHAYFKPYTLKKANREIGVFLILVFCLFPFWGGDYFHYYQAFYDYNHGGWLSQEKVYGWLYSTFSFSYTALRMAIWGPALILLTTAYKYSSPKYDLCVFLFGALYLHWFSYARASLAMSCIILGLALVVGEKQKKVIIYKLLGVALLGVSVFFHRSAPVGIIAAIISLFLTNAKKSTVILMAIGVPLLIYALQWGLDYFANMNLNDESLITEHYRDRFVNIEDNTGNGQTALGPLLTAIFSRWPLYLSAILYVTVVSNGSYHHFTNGERALSSYAFIIIIMSIGFGFTEGYSTHILEYRTLFFAMPANAIFLSAVHRTGCKNVLYNIVFWGALLGSVYNMAYAVWCSIVGS